MKTKYVYLGVFVLGLCLLVTGSLAWVISPWLTGDYRKGGEGAGLMGTVIFLFTFAPGLLFAMAGAGGFFFAKK